MKTKFSKSITELRKGDKLKVNGKEMEVDAHYIFEDYGSTKEMLLEIFDPKAKDGEGDYQIRYFDDQIEDSLKLYELKTIVYEEIELESIEW